MHFQFAVRIQYLRIWLLFWTPFVFGSLFHANLHSNHSIYFTIYNPSAWRRLHTIICPLRQ
jgi:hypothetical protein